MAQCILSIKDISKSFPGVKALSGVSFDVGRGCVHGLVGELLEQDVVEDDPSVVVGPLADRDLPDAGRRPDGELGVAVLADHVGVHVRLMQAGLAGDRPAQP